MMSSCMMRVLIPTTAIYTCLLDFEPHINIYCLWALSVVKLCRPLGACHVVKSRFTCTFTHICYFYSGSTIHIYPSISISRITKKYSIPNPGENSQKHFPIPVIPCEINALNILVTTTCCIISRDECSKKKRKKREEKKIYKRGNKKGKVPGTSKERKKVINSEDEDYDMDLPPYPLGFSRFPVFPPRRGDLIFNVSADEPAVDGETDEQRQLRKQRNADRARRRADEERQCWRSLSIKFNYQINKEKDLNEINI